MRIFSRVVPLLFCISLLFLISGCLNKPVRHLASDVSLIRENSSTKQDVLKYLGQPNEQTLLPDGSEAWKYEENLESDFQKLPLAGRAFKDQGCDTVIVVYGKDDVVKSLTYLQSGRNDLDWKKDFSWQKKKDE